jgi:riboflavin synthase
MFTGIVEATGVILSLEHNENNLSAWIETPFIQEIKLDQSIAHDGVCLTVDGLKDSLYRVTAVKETLEKTNLGSWKPGNYINLERAMKLGDRLDGHLVQGHVDATGTCIEIAENGGSWLFTFEYPEKFMPLIIEKGSICVNGTSLTAFGLNTNKFMVTIIPYTYEHTNISRLREGDSVNLEFDLVGKYIQRIKM